MTDSSSPAPARRDWLTIALLSAALLAFQVLLTRVCALRLHFHFGFLIISNSLLGIGASGSLLALCDARWRRDPAAWIRAFCMLFVLSLPASWAWLLWSSIPETLKFESWTEIRQFAAFNLACAVPFFFGGTAVGLILSSNAARVHRVYAADLLGAGLGCLLCPLLLWPIGAGGCFLVTVALAVLAALVAAPASALLRLLLAATGVAALAGAPFLDHWLPVPGKRYLDITQKATIEQIGLPVFTQWSANSRIDVIPLPPSMRGGFLQARGGAALAMPLPEQWWIAQDGDAGTMLSAFGKEPDKVAVLKHTMYATSFELMAARSPRVCVIGVGGAPDLWTARQYDCKSIRGIELNRSILDLHRGVALPFSKPLLDDPRIELVCDEGRSALMRSPDLFDVVQLTGIDTWTALNSGSYVLAENYLYTVEACRTMYEHLTEGGVLQITRMSAGMETIRLLHNMYAALPAAAQAAFAKSVAVLSTPDYLSAVLLKKGAFADDEVARLEAFADQNQIGKVVLPGRTLKTEVEEFVTTPDKQAFVDGYEFDISPTTDDRPYFFSFLRWSKPSKAFELRHQPTWVVQGNPWFLTFQLLGSAVAAALLIVLPLLFRRGASRPDRRGAVPFLCYFAALGVGFIAIEVALMQKFTLLLGQPLHSIVVTLCAILVGTGLGSLLGVPFVQARPGRARLLPVVLLLALLVVVFASPAIVRAAIGLPLALRAAIVVLLVLPIGFLLGIPFAHGVAVVERHNPSLVPWAWAVNGSLTVVGSILTVVLSMNFGFAAVLLIAAGVYFLAFLALGRAQRSIAA